MKIGLTYTGSEEKHFNYVHWLKGAEAGSKADMEVIKLSVEAGNLEEVKKCDAVVLSGGLDIHPRYYGHHNLHYPNMPQPFNESRDEFELAVFRIAQEEGKPVLGICRGMQLMNCALGGSLQQDLGPLNERHRAVEKDKTHALHVVPGTLLYDIAKEEICMANSAHHQAIDKLGSGLLINCTSDEGLAEGIEWKDKRNKPFLLGVQWHPERMSACQLQEAPMSKMVRSRFIEAVKISIEKKNENN